MLFCIGLLTVELWLCSFCSVDFRTLCDHCHVGQATLQIMSNILNTAVSCSCYESTIKKSSLKILLHEQFPQKLSVSPLSVSPPNVWAKLWDICCAEVPTFGFWYLATIAGKILTNFVEHWGHVGFYFIRTSIYTNIEAFTLWVVLPQPACDFFSTFSF